MNLCYRMFLTRSLTFNRLTHRLTDYSFSIPNNLFKKNGNHLRIELDSCEFFKLRFYFLQIKSITIYPTCCHSIKSIRDQNNPRTAWNILTTESMWITATIPILMMVSNHSFNFTLKK